MVITDLKWQSVGVRQKYIDEGEKGDWGKNEFWDEIKIWIGLWIEIKKVI